MSSQVGLAVRASESPVRVLYVFRGDTLVDLPPQKTYRTLTGLRRGYPCGSTSTKKKIELLQGSVESPISPQVYFHKNRIGLSQKTCRIQPSESPARVLYVFGGDILVERYRALSRMYVARSYSLDIGLFSFRYRSLFL